MFVPVSEEGLNFSFTPTAPDSRVQDQGAMGGFTWNKELGPEFL